MSNLNAKARNAASLFLNRRGYTVLECDWTCPAGTSDIVAREGDTLVFVDVSARSGADRGFPAEAHGGDVRVRREMIALAWLAEHANEVNETVRFDNIALVTIGNNRAMIRHHINVLGEAAAAICPETCRPSRGRDLQTLSEAA